MKDAMYVVDIKGPQSTCGSQPEDNTPHSTYSLQQYTQLNRDHAIVNTWFTTTYSNQCRQHHSCQPRVHDTVHDNILTPM